MFWSDREAEIVYCAVRRKAHIAKTKDTLAATTSDASLWESPLPDWLGNDPHP